MQKNILITGGTGLIGRHLFSCLQQKGYSVRILTRNRSLCHQNSGYYLWDPYNNFIECSALDNVGVIINLAGAGIADKRWTKERKKVLLESRLSSIDCLKNNLKKLESKPLIIAASAIGYYGDRGSEVLDEYSGPGHGYLSGLTGLWEGKSKELEDLSDRFVLLRIGIILSTKGGALKKIRYTSNMGLYQYFGNGKAYYSWIHIEELIEIISRTIINSEYRGIINAVSVNPVSNKFMIKTLKKIENKFGLILSVPVFTLKMLLGEMATLVLDSTRVSPRKLLRLGYEFRFPDLEEALKDILERKV